MVWPRSFPVVLLICLCVVSAGAEQRELGERRTHVVTRAAGDIIIDGVVDEPAWDTALHLELEYEVTPGENIPAPIRTDVFITYDDDRLLVAFRCFDPDPESIRARFWDRDQAWTDDWIGIMLDTFGDQRRAYEFVVNPFGVQIDAVNNEVGGRYDHTWDAIWDSAGRLIDGGWEAEIAVPYDQIRFQPTDGPQRWGVDVFRSYPRSDRHHVTLFPRDRGNNSLLSQTDWLEGFEGADPGNSLELAPTVTWGRLDERPDLPDAELEEVDSDLEAGLTVIWGITPNIILSGALNPDFSQVEADVVQLGINRQFALFFPETRPFFLEAVDTFETPLSLVHTRTVVDPSIALKISGKEGAHTFGLFTARDEVTNVLVPGDESSSSASFDQESTTTVGRYRYDVGESSTIGAALTDRRGSGYDNTVLSFDARLRFSEDDVLEVNLAGSDTTYNGAMGSEFGLLEDELEANDVAWYLNYRHSERNWNATAFYEDLGSDFRADVGFIPQVGFRKGRVGANRLWWGDAGDAYNTITVGGDFEYTESHGNGLLERELEGWIGYEGPQQSQVHGGMGTRTRVFEGVAFDQDFYWANASIRPTGSFAAGFNVSAGDWIDFSHVRPAEQASASAWAEVNAGAHWHLNLSHDWSRLDVDEGRLFTTNLTRLRVVYQLNRRLFVRGVVQYVDVTRSPELYIDDVAAEEEDLFTQLLLSYTLNPRSVVFVGYSDVASAVGGQSLLRASRTLFVKLGYAWSL